MTQFSRRSFIKSASALGLAAFAFPTPSIARELNANSKLNLAHIGLGGMQGDFHRNSCAEENRIAICDVDENYLEQYGAQIPDAKRYVDFREMIDELGDQIDAVVITTPDHTHAIAAITAMKKGIAAYVEKPLAHDVYQIRQMQKLAREKGLATQMGTQIHALDNYRRVVELVRAGVIGKIERVDVWCGVVWGGSPRTNDDVKVPEKLHWDLWLGPAPERPFQPCYLGGNWRSFWDFGNGGMGDMGCHFMDLVFWALDLQYPISIDAFAPTKADDDFAARDLHVEYVFPGVKGTTNLLEVSWSDGVARPGSLDKYGIDKPNGVLFIGSEGAIYSNYSEHAIFPTEKFAKLERPAQTIPASIGHHKEWLQAIKTGKKDTTCNFDYSGRVAETILLGPVAYRCGKKLEYDAKTMTITNCPEAAKLLKQDVRKGWEV